MYYYCVWSWQFSQQELCLRVVCACLGITFSCYHFGSVLQCTFWLVKCAWLIKSSPFTAYEQTQGNTCICVFYPIMSTYSLQVVMWTFQLSFIHFFKLFSLTEFPIATPGNSNLFCRGVWIFSRTMAHCYIIIMHFLRKLYVSPGSATTCWSTQASLPADSRQNGSSSWWEPKSTAWRLLWDVSKPAVLTTCWICIKSDCHGG